MENDLIAPLSTNFPWARNDSLNLISHRSVTDKSKDVNTVRKTQTVKRKLGPRLLHYLHFKPPHPL